MTEFKISLTTEQEFHIRSQIRSIFISEVEKLKVPQVVEQRYLNKKQTCRYLGISHNTLDKWLQQGLPYINIQGMTRFDKQKVDQWLAELTQSI